MSEQNAANSLAAERARAAAEVELAKALAAAETAAAVAAAEEKAKAEADARRELEQVGMAWCRRKMCGKVSCSMVHGSVRGGAVSWGSGPLVQQVCAEIRALASL